MTRTPWGRPAPRTGSAGQVTQPVRTVLEVGPDRSFFGLMPAALDSPPAVGAKLVTVWPRNHERGLPSHLATIVLLDHETGAIAALLDGRYITEARTAAVSAVSAGHLARKDALCVISVVVGMVDSGVDWRHVHGGAWLGGIGFTMSLFVADLAFGEASLELAKIGILAASVIAGVGGYVVLWRIHATR